MRAFLLPSLLLLASLPGLAGAHVHPGCDDATTHQGNLHLWTGGECIGATVTTPAAQCIVLGHVDVPGLHVLVINGPGCETGVLLDCDNELFVLRLCGLGALP